MTLKEKKTLKDIVFNYMLNKYLLKIIVYYYQIINYQ